MTGFVLAILVFVAVISMIFFLRSKKMEKEQQKQLPPGFETPTDVDGDEGERTVRNIQLGDIVSYFGTDYLVEGRLDYNEDGWTWITYMLVDGEEVKWLAVEEDDQLEVSMWDEVYDADISGPRPPEHVEYQGEEFEMFEFGEARVTQTGKTGRKTGLTMEYFEYEGSGNRYLSVEKWGNEIEVSIGEDINPVALEIFPGNASNL